MTTGGLSEARALHTQTLLWPSGNVLVDGGFPLFRARGSVQIYDPGSGTWKTTKSAGGARFSHTATLLPDGTVLVAGGQRNSSLLMSAELYDPVLRTWTGTGSLITARESHTATSLFDGRVLVVGGRGQNAIELASAELYNPK